MSPDDEMSPEQRANIRQALARMRYEQKTRRDWASAPIDPGHDPRWLAECDTVDTIAILTSMRHFFVREAQASASYVGLSGTQFDADAAVAVLDTILSALRP